MSLVVLAASLAHPRLGLVARSSLVRAGAAPAAVDSAVRRSQLLVEAPAVYRLPWVPASADTRLLAEILRSGTGARCSHLTAAWLWGLVTLPPHRHEISAVRGTRLRSPSVVVHESRDLHLDVAGEVRGLPVTGVARTILDCAGRPDVDLELLVDRARRNHDLSAGALPDVVLRHSRPGRTGVAALRALVADGAVPDSDFERFFLRFLAERGIREPVLHHRVRLASGRDAVLDLAWPELMVAIELDGSDHWKRRAVFESDRVRQNQLVNAGWLVLRFTWRQFVADPEGVAAQIAVALDRVGAA